MTDDLKQKLKEALIQSEKPEEDKKRDKPGHKSLKWIKVLILFLILTEITIHIDSRKDQPENTNQPANDIRIQTVDTVNQEDPEIIYADDLNIHFGIFGCAARKSTLKRVKSIDPGFNTI